jgi:hypothetical protein
MAVNSHAPSRTTAHHSSPPAESAATKRAMLAQNRGIAVRRLPRRPTTKQTFGASAVQCDGLGARRRRLEKCRHPSIHRCRQSPAGAVDLPAVNLFAGALCRSIPSPADAPARQKGHKARAKSVDRRLDGGCWQGRLSRCFFRREEPDETSGVRLQLRGQALKPQRA